MKNVLVAALLFSPLLAHADDAAWQALEVTGKELRTQEAERKLVNAAIEVYREQLTTAKLAELRRGVEEAEKALAAVQPAQHEKMQQTRAARDAKVAELLANAVTFQAAVARRSELQQRIATSQPKSATDFLELARLQMEEQRLAKQIYSAQKAWWKRGEVAAEYKAADDAYKAYGALKLPALQQANEKLKSARKALAEATAALPLEDAVGKALLARQADLTGKIESLQAKVAELEKPLLAGARTVSITVKAFDRKTKQEVDKKLTLWLPPGEYVRGVILAHPMISKLAEAQPIRLAAAREGLAMMVYDQFLNDIPESLARIDETLAKLAAEAKRPELKGAPLLLGGLSASVLATRNIACRFPERVFGIVHAAGGNMQEMPDDGRGMVQVPFLAHNGEFEWCGPIGGIQPAYGSQTQWVMIREQMLRLWRNKHEHRMALVVVPNADHGAWDVELTALFVRKAAQYRIANEKRDGSKPAVCQPLPANKGWLTDADLDHPRFEPAAYDSYKGDKNNAFWYFDEALARAVYHFHKDKFLLPDPTKTKPVPTDWPPKQ